MLKNHQTRKLSHDVFNTIGQSTTLVNKAIARSHNISNLRRPLGPDVKVDKLFIDTALYSSLPAR